MRLVSVADEISPVGLDIFLFGIDKVANTDMRSRPTRPCSPTTSIWTLHPTSPAQKKVIDDHCTPEWAAKVAGPWAEFEANGRVKMKALAGHEVYPLTDDQLAQWKQAETVACQLGGGQKKVRRSRATADPQGDRQVRRWVVDSKPFPGQWGAYCEALSMRVIERSEMAPWCVASSSNSSLSFPREGGRGSPSTSVIS